MDWIAHKKHRQEVVASTGEWRGLADENGVPLMDLPPAISLSAPETRLSPQSAKVTLPILSRRGVVHPAFGELIGDGIGVQDPEGRLVLTLDATRFFVVERPGGIRRTYRVVFTALEEATRTPSTLEINATDMLRMLTGIPAMSAPTTWKAGQFTRFTRDWAGPENVGVTFREPRDLKGMQMITVADGATIEGPAEATIRRLITESIDAAATAVGITDPPIKVSPLGSGKPSPHVLIRPTDKPLWEEIAPTALAAGVRITARMWWPEDPQPHGLTLTSPKVVITVQQI